MRRFTLVAIALTSTSVLVSQAPVKTGAAAFQDIFAEKPGNRVHVTVADLPEPAPSESVANFAAIIHRPADAVPQAPAGYRVQLYAEGVFQAPRLMRTAPNGDVFLSDSDGGKIYVLRGVGADGKAVTVKEFAADLKRPFGINFWPAINPKYVYVASTGSVVRYPYVDGDLTARGPAEVLIKDLPGFAQLAGGGHWTRDVVFSKDGSRMFVSVGSGSNIDDPDTHPNEFHRADVLEFKPDGTFVKVYAAGIRNCVGEAIQPATGQLWCSTNERDGLGNHLVPDYITHVEEGGFYGWPYFYMGGSGGGRPEPRNAGKHPELQAKTITPDVLMQPHMASLSITFYTGNMFPNSAGDIFAAEHGSWNRKPRAGYEVARVIVRNGKATGEYEDFLTGFTTASGDVWGRPVGVTMMKDGSLLVSEDGNNTVWRVTYNGAQK